jgi:hypothetical protein
MTDIIEEQAIWYPGSDYKGRAGDYLKIVSDIPEEQLIRLVQQRAREDGEWSIEYYSLDRTKDLMRRMMSWVSDSRNIIQCMEANPNKTVDWICRELANITRELGGGRG